MMVDWCVGCKAYGIYELAQVVESTDFGDLSLCHHCKRFYDAYKQDVELVNSLERVRDTTVEAVNVLEKYLTELRCEVNELRTQVEQNMAIIKLLCERFAGGN